MLVNVLFDGLLQFPSAAEHPAAQLLLCQHREPALHLVQPRAAGGGEVQVIARPPGQPALERGSCGWRLSRIRCTSRSGGTVASTRSRKRRNSVDRCDGGAPMTSVFTSRAAKREVVP